MIEKWTSLTHSPKYMGHNFLRLRDGLNSVSPSHIKGGPWLRGALMKYNRRTARMVRGLTGHAPIGDYRQRFFPEEPSQCMCGSPFESVIHIIHLCPLWSRDASPAKRVQLEVFKRFLKVNPRVFEFPGADLEQSNEGGTPQGHQGATGGPGPGSSGGKRWGPWLLERCLTTKGYPWAHTRR
jgi:hypothetical protein